MSLQRAIRIATLKHGQSVDKGGQPFIGHPLRVMARVAAAYPDAPEWALEAAVCHDVIEDTGTDAMELYTEGLEEEAVNLVKVLSRTNDQSYFEYIKAVKHYGGWAIKIKLEDLGDNLNPQRRVPGMKLPERYERAVAILRS